MKQNIFFDRQRFEVLKDWCKKEKVTPQLSKIRLSRELRDGVGAYEFLLDDKKMDLVAGDVALNRNDLFVPMSIGLFLQVDEKNPSGKAPLYTYPLGKNRQLRYFKKVEDVEAIYNGLMKIEMDTTVVNQSFPCEVFRWVPETQPVMMLDSSNKEQTTGLLPQFDASESMFPLAPEYYFQGTIDTKISVLFNGQNSNFTVVEPTDDSDSSTHKARLVLLMTGVLVKNAADKAIDVSQLMNR